MTHGFVDSVLCDDSCTVGEKRSHCAKGSSSVSGNEPRAQPAKQTAKRANAPAMRSQCSGVALYAAGESKCRCSSSSSSRLMAESPTVGSLRPPTPSACHASPRAAATGGIADACPSVTGGDDS